MADSKGKVVGSLIASGAERPCNADVLLAQLLKKLRRAHQVIVHRRPSLIPFKIVDQFAYHSRLHH